MFGLVFSSWRLVVLRLVSLLFRVAVFGVGFRVLLSSCFCSVCMVCFCAAFRAFASFCRAVASASALSSAFTWFMALPRSWARSAHVGVMFSSSEGMVSAAAASSVLLRAFAVGLFIGLRLAAVRCFQIGSSVSSIVCLFR